MNEIYEDAVLALTLLQSEFGMEVSYGLSLQISVIVIADKGNPEPLRYDLCQRDHPIANVPRDEAQ